MVRKIAQISVAFRK